MQRLVLSVHAPEVCNWHLVLTVLLNQCLFCSSVPITMDYKYFMKIMQKRTSMELLSYLRVTTPNSKVYQIWEEPDEFE